MAWRWACWLAVAWLLAGNAWAQPGSENPGTTDTERWIWEQARAGEIADLHARCGAVLDARNGADPRWRAPCRQVSAAFLERALTGEGWRRAPAHRGFRLVGARVAERLDLVGARIEMPVSLIETRFEAEVILLDARVQGLLFLASSAFERGIMAGRMQLAGSLSLPAARIGPSGSLVLRAAAIEGNLELDGAVLLGGLDADGLSVGRNLFFRGGGTAAFVLRGAAVQGNLELDGSRFVAGLDADSLALGRSLYLRERATVRGEPLTLRNARVTARVELDNATFEAGVDANGLTAGAGLSFERATVRGGPLVLRAARVEGNLDLVNAEVATAVIGDALSVGGAMLLRDTRFAVPPAFEFVRVGSILDLSGAALPGLTLAGGVVAGDLRLGSGAAPPPRWTADATLNLRNLRVGAIEDSWAAPQPDAAAPCAGEAGTDLPMAWPCRVVLRGFAYDRLGGLIGGGDRDMSLRDPAYFLALLARDPDPGFSRQPYQQLAVALRAAGDGDRADTILVGARDREMQYEWQAGGCGRGLGLLRLEGACWRAAGLFLLKATIGYGIGGGAWLALAWVGGLCLLGTLVLRASPAARAKGLAWRLGASLDRLLPIIELNPEFEAFFDDPARERLRGWQLAYFSAHAVAGYALAAFVAAAMAGLTQAG
ncbi:MAG: hypothetical protein MUC64_00570 [Rubritepida sp.]|nr:hypothetical protein [Rubritepida sp.]